MIDQEQINQFQNDTTSDDSDYIDEDYYQKKELLTAQQSIMIEQMYQGKIKNLNKEQISKDMKTELQTKILIICTGGTISMFPSDEGLVVKKGIMQQFISQNLFFCDKEYTRKYGDNKFFITPESIYGKRSYYKFEELENPIDSSNMTPAYHIMIAEIISNNYENYDAFIILHGTDTMAYTASTLSFVLENLGKIVIITGSMIPMCEPGNDAFNNFLSVLTIAGHYNIPEVTIFMGDKLMRGNRTVKNSSEKLDSFDSPNYQPLAILKKNFQFNKNIILPQPTNKFKFHNKIEENIINVQITPFANINCLKIFFMDPQIKGIILQTYGSGNIPTNNTELIKLIDQASKRGVLIVNISQNYMSNVSAVYQTGLVLQKLGVLFANDMVFEAALSKMAFVLSLDDLTLNEKKSKFMEDLRGEITQEKEQKIIQLYEKKKNKEIVEQRKQSLIQLEIQQQIQSINEGQKKLETIPSISSELNIGSENNIQSQKVEKTDENNLIQRNIDNDNNIQQSQQNFGQISNKKTILKNNNQDDNKIIQNIQKHQDQQNFSKLINIIINFICCNCKRKNKQMNE